MIDRFSLPKMFRPCCPRCSGRVQWFLGVAAPRTLGEDLCAEVLGHFPPSLRDSAAVWFCRPCREAGAFGPAETG